MASQTKHPERPEASTTSLVLKAISHLLDGKPDLLNRILAVVEAGADHPTNEGERPIKMQITPSIHRSYEQREMFPQYRPEHAAKVLPSLAAVFFVTVEEAEEVLRDAKEQRRKKDGPRGQAKAFTGLIDALENSIQNEKFRGCIEFPGDETVDAERRAESALLKVGERVAVWRDDGSAGGQVTITGGYRGYLVLDDDGAYLDVDGRRVKYCHGYETQFPDGKKWFFPAGQLAPIGESYGHLRLVS